MKGLLNQLTESSRLVFLLGVFVFLYSWFASALLQFWVIPSLFSQTGATEGLVVLDSIGFDGIAKAKAAEIARLGWSNWDLRPQWQSPAGIASVFYVLFGPAPASMLPFNAAVHAISACMVMVILRNFFLPLPAILGALAFALNPASFEWVSQLHRDGIFILGNLLVLVGIIRLIDGSQSERARGFWYWITSMVSLFVGSGLIWVARPYWMQILLFTEICVLIFVMIGFLLNWMAMDRRRMIFLVGMFLFLTVIQLGVVRFHTPLYSIDIPASVDNDSGLGRKERGAEGGAEGGAKGVAKGVPPLTWQRSNWLPDTIERTFYRLASVRDGVLRSGGQTLIDGDWSLNSAGAILGYIPRALQVGLFSPFPEFWFGEASTPAMTIARKVAGGFMVFFYACLLGLFVGLVRMWKIALLWVVVGFSLIGIVFYAVAYPNIGTMVRFRYGFYMVLIGLGVASWWDFWREKIRGLS